MRRHAVLTAVATLGLIALGGMVTSKGAGMAVPDWPNSYGYNMYALPFSYWIGGALYEHTHRLLAATVGLLTTVLAIWLWARETAGRTRWAGIIGLAFVAALLGRMGAWQYPIFLTLAALAPVAIGIALFQHSRNPGTLRWLGMAAFAAVILQGVLGGLRVVWLADYLGIFHGTLAQLFLVLVVFIAVFASPRWPQLRLRFPVPTSLRNWLLATTVIVLLQLIVAASMRHQHAGLPVPDFPLAHGQLWPSTTTEAIHRYNLQRVETEALQPITAFQVNLHMTHRLLAGVVLVMVLLAALRARATLPSGHVVTRGTWAWLSLVLVQIALGAWTIWSNKAADVATLHVVTGALTLVAGALLTLVAAVPAPSPAAEGDRGGHCPAPTEGPLADSV